jgi:glycosyltransferase involved in cell wall biosynthesis
MKLAIIIPAYNEEKRIGNTLKEYLKYFKTLKQKKILDFTIFVIINNTTDNTESIVKTFSKKYKEIKYYNYKEGGKGFAIIEGFKSSLKEKNDLIGFVDADNATSPESYYDLVKNIGDYDGIIASRYIKGAIVKPKQTIQRIIASRMFNILIKILFLMQFNDTQCGAKIFKRKTIEKIINKLSVTKWAFDVDLLYLIKKNKLKVLEHPTIWSDKEYSHINLTKSGSRMVLAILRLRLLNSRLCSLVKFYDGLPEYLKISHKI